MTLDNMHDNELELDADRQEAADWGDALPELEWDEAEAQNIAIELTGRRHNEY